MAKLYIILVSCFAIITLVNIVYYLYLAKFSWKRSRQTSQVVPAQELPPISLIICAKNEADNLVKNIPKYIAQEYPKFEIILINDRSSDTTLEVMEEFAEKTSTIHIVNVAENENFWGSKKYALTLGIKRAKYNHLLLTDADCAPLSNLWMLHMASTFNTSRKIVLGYGALHKEKKSLLNKIIRLETVLTALQYLGYALQKNPYMGVGRNLAYTAETFNANRGFVEHLKIPSGDDDLFINGVATARNTAICDHPEAFTVSEAKKTWKAWFRQKRRHTSVARFYKKKHQVQLGLFYISQLGFIVLSLATLIAQEYLFFVCSILFIRYSIVWLVVGAAARKLKEKDLILLFPFLEIFLILSQLSIFIKNCFAKPTHWR